MCIPAGPGRRLRSIFNAADKQTRYHAFVQNPKLLPPSTLQNPIHFDNCCAPSPPVYHRLSEIHSWGASYSIPSVTAMHSCQFDVSGR